MPLRARVHPAKTVYSLSIPCIGQTSGNYFFRSSNGSSNTGFLRKKVHRSASQIKKRAEKKHFSLAG